MIIKSRPEDRKNKENENCIFVKKISFAYCSNHSLPIVKLEQKVSLYGMSRVAGYTYSTTVEEMKIINHQSSIINHHSLFINH